MFKRKEHVKKYNIFLSPSVLWNVFIKMEILTFWLWITEKGQTWFPRIFICRQHTQNSPFTLTTTALTYHRFSGGRADGTTSSSLWLAKLVLITPSFYHEASERIKLRMWTCKTVGCILSQTQVAVMAETITAPRMSQPMPPESYKSQTYTAVTNLTKLFLFLFFWERWEVVEISCIHQHSVFHQHCSKTTTCSMVIWAWVNVRGWHQELLL